MLPDTIVVSIANVDRKRGFTSSSNDEWRGNGKLAKDLFAIGKLRTHLDQQPGNEQALAGIKIR